MLAEHEAFCRVLCDDGNPSSLGPMSGEPGGAQGDREDEQMQCPVMRTSGGPTNERVSDLGGARTDVSKEVTELRPQGRRGVRQVDVPGRGHSRRNCRCFSPAGTQGPDGLGRDEDGDRAGARSPRPCGSRWGLGLYPAGTQSYARCTAHGGSHFIVNVRGWT